MNRGWIKLFRKSQDNDLYFADPFTHWQAWVDLILIANHKPGIINKRGNIIKIPKGTVGYSQLALADRWKWSRGKVQRFLEFLENEHQIVQQKKRITTLIKIINYELYQEHSTTDDTTDRTTDGQQTDINKNVKNVKKKRKVFVIPTIQEVKVYCSQRKNSVIPEKFISHYTSNGWKVGKNKMVCWKSAVHTWENSKPKEPIRIDTAEDTLKMLEEKENGTQNSPAIK